MKVIFEWEDGTKYRYDYPEAVKGIRHKGLKAYQFGSYRRCDRL